MKEFLTNDTTAMLIAIILVVAVVVMAVLGKTEGAGWTAVYGFAGLCVGRFIGKKE